MPESEMTSRIRLRTGDITTSPDVDVIVNAANSRLLGGGGVDGAIHRAAGPSVLEECRALGGCETGDAKITRAGRLGASWIVHAVGPVWHGGARGEAHLLASCHRRALELAAQHASRRVAMPAISTGAYGYPAREAAGIALMSVGLWLRDHPEVDEVTFWLFDRRMLDVFSEGLGRLRLAVEGGAKLGPDPSTGLPPLRRSYFGSRLSPMSERRALSFTRELSAEQATRLGAGHVSSDMDDRWHSYVEGDTLHLHRSWTGVEIFEARLDARGDGTATLSELVANGDQQQHRATDETASRTFGKVVDLLTAP